MDILIEYFGRPRFVKIDVEGYEFEVLAGLTSAVPFLSFEFSADALSAVEKCMAALEALGRYEFTLSLGESMSLAPGWHSKRDVIDMIRLLDDKYGWGDIYAKSVPLK